MCTYVPVCIYVCTCMYMFVHVCTCLYMYVCVWGYTSICMHMIYKHTCGACVAAEGAEVHTSITLYITVLCKIDRMCCFVCKNIAIVGYPMYMLYKLQILVLTYVRMYICTYVTDTCNNFKSNTITKPVAYMIIVTSVSLGACGVYIVTEVKAKFYL